MKRGVDESWPTSRAVGDPVFRAERYSDPWSSYLGFAAGDGRAWLEFCGRRIRNIAAGAVVVLQFNSAAVTFDKLSANGQPQPGSLGLSCKQGLKQLVAEFLADSRSRIPHSNDGIMAVLC